MNDIFKMALQAGALGVLLVMIVGFGWIIVKVAPEARAFLTGLLNTQKEITTKQAEISTRVDAVDDKAKAAVEAITKLPEAIITAMTQASETTSAAMMRLTETVRAEGAETRAQIIATETRLTGVIRREQQDASPSSRQSLQSLRRPG